MHQVAENGVHHPALEVFVPDAGDGAVVLYLEEDATALEVGQGDDFPGELFRPHVVPLELDPGVLAARHEFEEIRPFHRSPVEPLVSCH